MKSMIKLTGCCRSGYPCGGAHYYKTLAFLQDSGAKGCTDRIHAASDDGRSHFQTCQFGRFPGNPANHFVTADGSRQFLLIDPQCVEKRLMPPAFANIKKQCCRGPGIVDSKLHRSAVRPGSRPAPSVCKQR